jgi:membrane-associated protease RseP (regulator of RpoE activity)
MVLGFLQHGWLFDHRWPLLFYAALILLIVAFRKKIEWQTFGVGMYKTKVGLNLMERLGTKYRGFVRLLGYIGVGVGFIGMVFITGYLIHALWLLHSKPESPAAISLVIPGVSIPGSSITVPLIAGWIALFVVIVIHEFSHGVVSRAHNVPVKSSGLLVVGPLGGAFVEPDENKLKKENEIVQYSLFAAGPFSNVLLAVLLSVMLVYAFSPGLDAMTTPTGVEIVDVEAGLGAAEAHVPVGAIVHSVNAAATKDTAAMYSQLDSVSPGDQVVLGTDKGDYTVTTKQNPNDATSTKGYLGVKLRQHTTPKLAAAWFAGAITVFTQFNELVLWIIILSLGIGLANLLPLGPVDGGRMLQLASRQIVGDEKRGDLWWKRISIATLLVLLVLLLVPIGKAIFFG